MEDYEVHKVKKRDKMEDSSVSKERVEQNDGARTSLTAEFRSQLLRSLGVMGGNRGSTYQTSVFALRSILLLK